MVWKPTKLFCLSWASYLDFGDSSISQNTSETAGHNDPSGERKFSFKNIFFFVLSNKYNYRSPFTFDFLDPSTKLIFSPAFTLSFETEPHIHKQFIME